MVLTVPVILWVEPFFPVPACPYVSPPWKPGALCETLHAVHLICCTFPRTCHLNAKHSCCIVKWKQQEQQKQTRQSCNWLQAFWFDFFQFLFFKILDTFFILLEMWGEFWECYHVSSAHTTVYDFCHSFAVWGKLWELSLIAWCDMIDSGLIGLAMKCLKVGATVSNKELLYMISKINHCSLEFPLLQLY